MANRNECFSDYPRQKTAKERCHSLVSRMGDSEEYLEKPFPLPQSLYEWTDVRSLVRWRHNQHDFLSLMGYQFFLPMVLRWRASWA